MKIDVITLHRVRNYGSSLQTLATQNFLEQFGCEVEIIDYYPDRYTSWGLLKRLKYKSKKLEHNPILLLAARMIISVSYIKKKLVFDRFLKKYINLSPITYRNETDIKNNLPIADAYCTGSDQVWNSYWNEGIDTPLYLNFLPETTYKFSYAASIGNAKLSEIEKNAVRPMLKKYRHISVRENVGVDVIMDLGLKAEHVIDPTLLFREKEWEPYISNRFKKEEYVLTYNLHHDKRIDRYADELAKKCGLKVYNISYNIHDIVRSGKLKWCPTVEEYLGLIRDAQFVVTDSFHATVFSVLFHTKFMVIYPEQASSRIRSLLLLLNLEERGHENVPKVEQAEAEIDFRNADAILELERKKSRDYMSMIISEIKDRND